MSIDLSSFPTLLLVSSGLAEAGHAIRSNLSRTQLQECEQLAKDTKAITDSIESIRESGDETLALLIQSSNGDQLRDLGWAFRTRCIEPLPQAAPKPAPQSKTTQAFWATTPFQLLGAAQKLGRSIEDAAATTSTQVLGAAAFVGLAAAAVVRLRFGDTSLLQRLIPAL